MTRVYVTMVGDLFHVNHINLIKEAKEYGDHLIVGIHSDSQVQEYKCTPIMTLEERCYIISACKYVDSIIPGAPLNITEKFIKANNIDLVIHAHNLDEDRKYNFIFQIPKELGIFKRLDYHEGISTTGIKRRVVEQYKKGILNI